VISLRDDARDPEVDAPRLKSTAQTLLRAAGRPESEISVLLTNDASIRELNRAHRGKDKSTDVLSFPADDGAMLGDIAISVETARRQAAEYDAPLQNEIYRLLIHGLLHVLGHDHHEPAERAVMEAEERRLASAIAMPWPYD
jgi:probable rRNA maturation factor